MRWRAVTVSLSLIVGCVCVDAADAIPTTTRTVVLAGPLGSPVPVFCSRLAQVQTILGREFPKLDGKNGETPAIEVLQDVAGRKLTRPGGERVHGLDWGLAEAWRTFGADGKVTVGEAMAYLLDGPGLDVPFDNGDWCKVALVTDEQVIFLSVPSSDPAIGSGARRRAVPAAVRPTTRPAAMKSVPAIALGGYDRLGGGVRYWPTIAGDSREVAQILARPLPKPGLDNAQVPVAEVLEEATDRKITSSSLVPKATLLKTTLAEAWRDWSKGGELLAEDVIAELMRVPEERDGKAYTVCLFTDDYLILELVSVGADSAKVRLTTPRKSDKRPSVDK